MILFNKSITYKKISICYRSSSSITRLYSGGRIRDGLGIAKGYANNNNRYILETHTLSGLPEAISLSSSSSSSSFIVLGIESSCDDTGVAIVKSDGTILSNIVLSQVPYPNTNTNTDINTNTNTNTNSMRYMKSLEE